MAGCFMDELVLFAKRQDLFVPLLKCSLQCIWLTERLVALKKWVISDDDRPMMIQCDR